MFDPISIGLGIGAWKLGEYIYEEFNKSSIPPDPRKEVEIEELRNAEPVYFAVAILAKFAKLDGIVTKNEIATIERILSDIDLTGEGRNKAIHFFRKHKDGALSYEESLAIIAELAENDLDFRAAVCILLFRLAHAEGMAQQLAVQGVQHACEVMGIDYAEANQVFQEQERHRREAVSADFELLGCSPNDSMESIKKRYRELTRTFHPDTVTGKDLHPEITKLAAAKFRDIQEAYERIMSQHKAPNA
jgi:DnaJ like chaperone protein